ncbi:MAG: acyltransferase PapA5 [Methanobacterium sp. PtaU1.Bin242]|nr:MAG: acyltransferase PapA5 [Methanobacterium sp. PtaU1.Bin242]
MPTANRVNIERNKTIYKDQATNNSKYIRKLSNLERMYLWSPYSDVSMVIKISGNVSEERLYNALDIILQMHPLAGAKIVLDDEYNAWLSTDNVPKPTIKSVRRVSDTQWFDELRHEIQIPFNPETGPLIRFVLLHSETLSDLVIICNHSICDGMSLVYLVRDLLNNYKNPEKEIKVIPPIDIINLFPSEGFSLQSVIMKLVMGRANRKWEKKPYRFTHKDAVALQDAYWEKYKFNTVLLELEPAETESLLEKCRNKGVSIGSAVITAFIAAHEDLVAPFAGNQKQLWVPFDLRRHATTPIDDVFCFCVGAPRFSYTYKSNRSFWDNCLVMHKEIHKRVKELDSAAIETPDFDPALLDALSAFALLKDTIPEAYAKTENLSRFIQDEKNIAFSFAKKSAHMIPGTIASNLGRLDIPEIYGDLKIEKMIFIPVISDSIPLNLGGISIGNNMVFSMSYAELRDVQSPITKEKIDVRNRALDYLGFPDNRSECNSEYSTKQC